MGTRVGKLCPFPAERRRPASQAIFLPLHRKYDTIIDACGLGGACRPLRVLYDNQNFSESG